MSRLTKLAFLSCLLVATTVHASAWHHHVARSKAKAAAQASAQAPASDEAVSQPKNVKETAASQLRTGTQINAELQSAIDSRKTKVSDQVVARVTSDVKQDDQVIVHKGDRLVGRVSSVRANGDGQAGSSIDVAFDRLVTQHSVMPLKTVLVALAPAPRPQAVENEPVMRAPMPAGGSRRSTSGLLGATGSSLSAATGATVGATGSVLAAGDTTPGTVHTLGRADAASNVEGALSNIQITSHSQTETRSAANSVLSSREGNLHLDSGTRLQFEVARSAQTVAMK